MIVPATKLDLHGMTLPQLRVQLQAWDIPAVHAARVWKYLYREGVETIEQMSELPARLQRQLHEQATLGQLSIAQAAVSRDGFTRKYLLQLHDGRRIETVLMRYRGRTTACVSSQVGCAMGCVFCATGQMGFERHLSAGEIVAQALHVDRIVRAASNDGDRERLRNIVLMGMGEPLHNYDAVLHAIDILREHGGLGIGAKQITLSTVGVVPGIVRLTEERRTVSLAVSLHAATQAERDALVPVARAWPLDELIGACRNYAARLGRHIFFEWTLIAGVNDSAEQARALANLLTDVPSHVNLIPLNPTAEYCGRASRTEAASDFQAILGQHGIPSTVRQRRGIDIAAGCGQLAASNS